MQRRSHVATFQRRDVATSRRLVNSSKSQKAAQRHDVPKSQHSHVATLRRHDVLTISASELKKARET